MTGEEAVKQLRAILGKFDSEEFYDNENAHGEADEIICSLLESLGYKEVVEAFWNVPKWYA